MFLALEAFLQSTLKILRTMKQYVTLITTLILFLLISISPKAQFTYVDTYNWAGVPDHLVNPSDALSSNFKDRINATLPERRSVPIYNPKLISSGSPETINLAKESNVWITFVSEGATYRNALGYYSYPTNNPPTTAPSASKISIIFPNASLSGFGGDLNGGDKLYIGKFPANTSIAFVLIVDGWDDSQGKVLVKSDILYSNAAFNPEADVNLKRHTVVINDDKSERLVVGFEDIRRDDVQCDHDFNDLIFYATLDSKTCISNIDDYPSTNDGSVVNSGNTGGLESKSLGDIVGRRMLNSYKSGKNAPINYARLTKINPRQFALFGGNNPSIQSVSLLDIMPKRVYDTGYDAYFTSPTDITGFTNAKEVISIDFTSKSNCKAVAFATKTLGSIYTHTKPVCDRLKGSEIIDISKFTLEGLEFVRYTLKKQDGLLEYATSFTIGKHTGRSEFSFQSNWLTKDYTNDDVMYNYQLWASAPYLVTDMLLEVIHQLRAIAPINAFAVAADLPKTYVNKANRSAGKLTFNIQNNAANTSGYFEVDEKLSEQSNKVTKSYPFTIDANGNSIVSIPVHDAYEHDVRMVIGNKLEDVLYVNDGNWSIDYNANTTTLTDFTVSNAVDSSYTTDYPLYRNVHVEAATSDYVTIYKLVKGGGAVENLSDYSYLHFSANGGNNLRITILKKSISTWDNQYSFVIPLAAEQKEYNISLAEFTSIANAANIDLSDVTTIVFSIELANGGYGTINNTLSNVGFAKAPIHTDSILISEMSKAVKVYPNPSNGRFNCELNATESMDIILNVIEVGSGRVVYTKAYSASKGLNTLSLDITSAVRENANYILKIATPVVNYASPKVFIRK